MSRDSNEYIPLKGALTKCPFHTSALFQVETFTSEHIAFDLSAKEYKQEYFQSISTLFNQFITLKGQEWEKALLAISLEENMNLDIIWSQEDVLFDKKLPELCIDIIFKFFDDFFDTIPLEQDKNASFDKIWQLYLRGNATITEDKVDLDMDYFESERKGNYTDQIRFLFSEYLRIPIEQFFSFWYQLDISLVLGGSQSINFKEKKIFILSCCFNFH